MNPSPLQGISFPGLSVIFMKFNADFYIEIDASIEMKKKKENFLFSFSSRETDNDENDDENDYPASFASPPARNYLYASHFQLSPRELSNNLPR